MFRNNGNLYYVSLANADLGSISYGSRVSSSSGACSVSSGTSSAGRTKTIQVNNGAITGVLDSDLPVPSAITVVTIPIP